jgi:mono/diheme cytochrome c family protein
MDRRHEMRKRNWTALFAATAVVLLTACGGDGDRADAPPAGDGATPAPQQAPVGSNVELPEGVTMEMVAQGKTVFETSTCWTCHGMDAAGGPLAPTLRDQTWLNADGSFESIMQIVREGVATPVEHPGAMPPMGGAQLTDDQIRQVSAYVYAISHGG